MERGGPVFRSDPILRRRPTLRSRPVLGGRPARAAVAVLLGAATLTALTVAPAGAAPTTATTTQTLDYGCGLPDSGVTTIPWVVTVTAPEAVAPGATVTLSDLTLSAALNSPPTVATWVVTNASLGITVSQGTPSFLVTSTATPQPVPVTGTFTMSFPAVQVTAGSSGTMWIGAPAFTFTEATSLSAGTFMYTCTQTPAGNPVTSVPIAAESTVPLGSVGGAGVAAVLGLGMAGTYGFRRRGRALRPGR